MCHRSCVGHLGVQGLGHCLRGSGSCAHSRMAVSARLCIKRGLQAFCHLFICLAYAQKQPLTEPVTQADERSGSGFQSMHYYPPQEGMITL